MMYYAVKRVPGKGCVVRSGPGLMKRTTEYKIRQHVKSRCSRKFTCFLYGLKQYKQIKNQKHNSQYSSD